MKRIFAILMSVAVLGSAGMMAQQTATNTAKETTERVSRETQYFKGIVLTDAQKAKIDAIHAERKAKAEAAKAERKAQAEANKAEKAGKKAEMKAEKAGKKAEMKAEKAGKKAKKDGKRLEGKFHKGHGKCAGDSTACAAKQGKKQCCGADSAACAAKQGGKCCKSGKQGKPGMRSEAAKARKADMDNYIQQVKEVLTPEQYVVFLENVVTTNKAQTGRGGRR